MPPLFRTSLVRTLTLGHGEDTHCYFFCDEFPDASPAPSIIHRFYLVLLWSAMSKNCGIDLLTYTCELPLLPVHFLPATPHLLTPSLPGFRTSSSGGQDHSHTTHLPICTFAHWQITLLHTHFPKPHGHSGRFCRFCHFLPQREHWPLCPHPSLIKVLINSCPAKYPGLNGLCCRFWR